MKIGLPPTISYLPIYYDYTSVELTDEDIIDHAISVLRQIGAVNFHSTQQSVYAEPTADGVSIAVFTNIERGVVLVIVSGHDEDVGYEALDRIDMVWTGKSASGDCDHRGAENVTVH
jgi:hypothetical protein